MHIECFPAAMDGLLTNEVLRPLKGQSTSDSFPCADGAITVSSFSVPLRDVSLFGEWT